MPDTQPEPVFRTSSFCQDGGCVEVAVLPSGVVLVRDKKNSASDSPILAFGAGAWGAFRRGLDAGAHRAD